MAFGDDKELDFGGGFGDFGGFGDLVNQVTDPTGLTKVEFDTPTSSVSPTPSYLAEGTFETTWDQWFDRGQRGLLQGPEPAKGIAWSPGRFPNASTNTGVPAPVGASGGGAGGGGAGGGEGGGEGGAFPDPFAGLQDYEFPDVFESAKNFNFPDPFAGLQDYDFADPFSDFFMDTTAMDAYIADALPQVIGDAMGIAGFSGNRYSTAAMKSAGEVSGRLVSDAIFQNIQNNLRLAEDTWGRSNDIFGNQLNLGNSQANYSLGQAGYGAGIAGDEASYLLGQFGGNTALANAIGDYSLGQFDRIFGAGVYADNRDLDNFWKDILGRYGFAEPNGGFPVLNGPADPGIADYLKIIQGTPGGAGPFGG